MTTSSRGQHSLRTAQTSVPARASAEAIERHATSVRVAILHRPGLAPEEVNTAQTAPLSRSTRAEELMRKLSALLVVSTLAAGCAVGDSADPPGNASGGAHGSGCGCPEDSVC